MKPSPQLLATLAAAAAVRLLAPALQPLAATNPAYTNFESSQVHPIALTPSRTRLLAVNTPDAMLEVFSVSPSGDLAPLVSIPVGLEPVTVAARTDTEAWVVNRLSDTVSIVDLTTGLTTRTLPATAVGDEPMDVVFANGKAFVAVAGEDAVKVFSLANLDAAPTKVALTGSDTRALAVSPDGTKVYAIVQNSGNQTAVVNANIIQSNTSSLDTTRLAALGLNNTICKEPPARPAYPPLPPGVSRNPALTDPSAPTQPPVGLIVKWDRASGAWKDEAGQDWTTCLPFRLPDHDLFVINTATLAVTTVDHLGTTLFEVSVNPATGKIYVPNTDARNNVRFELPPPNPPTTPTSGVRGHVVDNQLSIVDPSAGNAVTIVDLNTHIDRYSDPATNIAERAASISQPGMMVWNAAGTYGYLTAIGSRKVFRVSGACASGPCIFGASRSSPDAALVGEGPTGVALNEPMNRLYVLDRFSNSIAVVQASTLSKLRDVPLHDPSSTTIKAGRHFLYDGIDTSGHGDTACSSCHISGDRDGLAWDLGDPTGSFVAYGTAGDNVRFIVPNPATNAPAECPTPTQCSSHLGFDPQKGPMATQTLRAMLEPLHWRGDRPTMNAFNKAFVGLLGKEDIGPINGQPAGLPADQMELFRQFALGVQFPPNPHRNTDDTPPNQTLPFPGVTYSGNPAAGEVVFNTARTDANSSCTACHALPFGTAGGKLGGIEPGDPSTAEAALFNGNADKSPHSDIKVPHTRNMYQKIGPHFGLIGSTTDPPADQKRGFGYTHDGSVPDLGTFLSFNVFTLTAQQAKDLTYFLFHFPTGVKPAVGQNVTVPAGAPPTGSASQESLLSSLISLGNLADANRHCELVASTRKDGRIRTYALNGGAGSGGLWTTDVAGEGQVTTAALRAGAQGPVSFLCSPLGSGVRLGTDRDLDGHLNGSDCAPADEGAFAQPGEVSGQQIAGEAPTVLSWSSQTASTGPGVVYDVAGGSLLALHASGLAAATGCLAGGLAPTSWQDARGNPAPGDGYFYLSAARNSCGSGGWGAERAAIASLTCPGP